MKNSNTSHMLLQTFRRSNLVCCHQLRSLAIQTVSAAIIFNYKPFYSFFQVDGTDLARLYVNLPFESQPLFSLQHMGSTQSIFNKPPFLVQALFHLLNHLEVRPLGFLAFRSQDLWRQFPGLSEFGTWNCNGLVKCSDSQAHRMCLSTQTLILFFWRI